MSYRKKEQELIHELLHESASAEFREETLKVTLAYARGRRNRRALLHTVFKSVAILLTAVGLFFIYCRTPVIESQNHLEAAGDPFTKPPTIEGTNIQILTDEELFALFPNTPIAMVTSSDGPRLVFLDQLE